MCIVARIKHDCYRFWVLKCGRNASSLVISPAMRLEAVCHLRFDPDVTHVRKLLLVYPAASGCGLSPAALSGVKEEADLLAVGIGDHPLVVPSFSVVRFL